MRKVSKQMSTFNLGSLFGTETSPTYSQEQSPVESFLVSTMQTVTVEDVGEESKKTPPRKIVKTQKRMSRRMSTFNLGSLFGTDTSPTYSQEEIAKGNSPQESYNVTTYESVTASAAEEISDATEDQFDSLSSDSLNLSALNDEDDEDYEPTEEQMAKMKQLMARKPPTPRTPKTDIVANMKLKKVIRDWEKNARMMSFCRLQPVPVLPFSGFIGVNPHTPGRMRKARRLSNFVPNVDTTSLYDMQDSKTPNTTLNADTNCVVHRLQTTVSRPNDFVSPEALPEPLSRHKVS